MAGSTEVLEHQYNIRCTKFHINDSGKGISINVDYTNGISSIPDCRFATVACEEDLQLLSQTLQAYLKHPRKGSKKKSKIIKHDFLLHKK